MFAICWYLKAGAISLWTLSMVGEIIGAVDVAICKP